MSEHELEKLLGGFAADTLTADERHRLYTAALHDQPLFNALADEQALKELLADPTVRRRLLKALRQASPSRAGGPLSWLDWLKRPAGLAIAGGLAAAALAVVLGTKIYQDSLRQAAQSVTTEETKPAASSTSPALPPPQRTEPLGKAQDHKKPAAAPAQKDGLPDQAMRQEPSAATISDAETAQADRAALEQHPQQEQTASSGPPPAPNRAPEAAAPQSYHQPEPPATAPLSPPAGTVPPTVSARSLFYSTISEPIVEEARRSPTAARKQARPSDSLAETPLQERKREETRGGLRGKSDSKTLSAGRPLGIRYSLIMKGPGGIDMEVDPSTPVGADDVPRLAIQANETGYLAILVAPPTSEQPRPLFPSSGEGHVISGTTIAISLSQVFESHPAMDQVRLVVGFSRRPLPLPLPLSSPTDPLLIEPIDPSQAGQPAEQATYVVNPAPPPQGTLLFEIPLSLRP